MLIPGKEFYSENSHCNNLPKDMAESPSQGFQDVIGKGARSSHQGSLSHRRLDLREDDPSRLFCDCKQLH